METRIKPMINTAIIRAEVWEKTGGKCWYCGELTIPWRSFCIDHFVNKVEEFTNLVPCCRLCNRLKNNGNIGHLRRLLIKRGGVREFVFYFEEMELMP